MKFEVLSTFEVRCCKALPEPTEFADQHRALEYLLAHVKAAHPATYRSLEREGRELARSQNGLGYYDGSNKDTGWGKAQESFRQAWILKALKQAVEEDD